MSSKGPLPTNREKRARVIQNHITTEASGSHSRFPGFFVFLGAVFCNPQKNKQKQRDRHVGHAFPGIWYARFGHRAALLLLPLHAKHLIHMQNTTFHAEHHMQNTTRRHLGD